MVHDAIMHGIRYITDRADGESLVRIALHPTDMTVFIFAPGHYGRVSQLRGQIKKLDKQIIEVLKNDPPVKKVREAMAAIWRKMDDKASRASNLKKCTQLQKPMEVNHKILTP